MKEQTPIRKAVALHYDEQKDKAPRVIATGKGHVADNIIKEAKKSRGPDSRRSDPCRINAPFDGR